MKGTDDKMFMRRCLQLAANGLLTSRPNPMVGAVVVARERIIGEGWHVRCGEAHAEVNAFASIDDADEKRLPLSVNRRVVMRMRPIVLKDGKRRPLVLPCRGIPLPAV